MKPKISSGVIKKILVYHDNERVGYGWITFYHNDRMSRPELYYDDGSEIPEGFYQLQMTDEEYVVVISRTKQ
jgi:hypothetical protein